MMKIIIFQGHGTKVSKVGQNKNIENFNFNIKCI